MSGTAVAGAVVGPSALDVRRGTTLSALAAREISALIIAGEFPQGARLNEAVLANRFGISRGPVREALRTIERDGLVVGVANRGVFVRRIDEQAAAEIYGLRAALFSMAGWLLATSATASTLDGLERLADSMDEAVAAQDLTTYYAGNLEFHAMLVQACGNARLAAQYAGLIQELHLYRKRSLVLPGRMAASNAEHRGIVAALRARDRDAAASLMRTHVLVSRDQVTGG